MAPHPPFSCLTSLHQADAVVVLGEVRVELYHPGDRLRRSLSYLPGDPGAAVRAGRRLRPGVEPGLEEVVELPAGHAFGAGDELLGGGVAVLLLQVPALQDL